jgi:predicted transcriptional regulator
MKTNKQKIRDFMDRHNFNQRQAGEALGVKRCAFSQYLSERENSLIVPNWLIISMANYDKIQELDNKLSKVKELDELLKKYDKIKTFIDGVEGME